MKSVKLKDGFNQVCVWPGSYLDTSERGIKEFELGVEGALGVRIQFLELVLTEPDTDESGNIIQGTGKRSDIIFAIHEEDIPKFAARRLAYGIRWIEDVFASCNYKCHIYPDHLYNYISWNEDAIKFPEGVACAL